MGYRVKPVMIVVIVAIALTVFVAVGFASYKLKLATAPDGSSNGTESEFVEGQTEKPEPEPCLGPEWKCNIRLHPEVYPVHYTLFLHPDFDAGLFTGKVTIELNITDNVDHVRLHTKYLQITSTVLTSQSTGESIAIENTFEVEHNEYWVVQLESSLTAGVVELTLEFNGNLTRGIVGLYRSQYYDPTQNVTKFVVSSKFQPTYARRAFPCFDEPSFKSTFTVQLIKPSNLVALSNMPVESEEVDTPGLNLTRVHFKKSIPMVTYLVAFAIGDFSFREGRTKSGIPVRIYATSFKVQHTEYAAYVTPKIVDFFEKYFDVKYPLPKLDIIGVPDFVSGAMEHWGMISFREVNLLFQPGVGSPMFKQRIASVISHELAHMWFGNLVTLKWWNDLWLNEGFASYMEYEGVHAIHPDWDIMSQFASEDLSSVLSLDGQLSSHPIVQPVSHPDQITEIFDTISYNKGASVIRMLQNFMGPRNFQQGVSKFLKKFAYKNAVTEDLWEGLQSEAPINVNISFVMDTWTRQMGYPILTASTSNPDFITVSQERFHENPQQRHIHQSSPFNFKWKIPLLFSTSAGASSTNLVWLPHTEKSVDINITKDTNWVKINTGQLGYFRVKYDSKHLMKMSLDFASKFSPEERCGLVDDVFALAFSNYTSYADAFQFALKMKGEHHIVPWKCIDPHLRKLLVLLNYSDANIYSLFRKYMNEITETQYKRLPWTDEETDPHLERLLKPRIFSLSCEHGIGDCRRQAKALFSQWLEGKYTIPTSIRIIVYKWGVAQSNETVWDIVWQKYLVETDASEKVLLLQALSFTKEPWIINKLLNYAKHETLIRRQDYFVLFRYIAYNPNGNPILWSYYRNQWDYLRDRFGINDRQLGRAIKYITEDYSEETQLLEMETFFDMYPEAGAGTRARKSAHENVQNNIQWVKRSLPTISDWLKSHYNTNY